MSQPVLLFDGVCNLCNGFVKFILKHEKHADILFAAIQSERGRKLLEQYHIRDTGLHTLYFVERDKVYEKSRAVFLIIRRMKSPVSWLRIFEIIPHRVADYLYDLVSRKRYLFFGKSATCMIPEAKWESRFIK